MALTHSGLPKLLLNDEKLYFLMEPEDGRATIYAAFPIAVVRTA